MAAAPAVRSRGEQGKILPVWPLWLFFAGFPVMWVLGLGGFATQIAAIPMATCLLSTGKVRVPRGFGVWMLFLIWMLFTVVEVQSSSKVIGFVYRASLYLAATVAFLYVYNSSQTKLPLTRLCAMATCLLAFVILGGLLGVIAPHGSLNTPFQHLVPARFAHNDLVAKLIHPPFAQVSSSTYVHIDPRPAAPFPYTNDWGANFALLVPFVLAWIALAKRTRTRVLLAGLLCIGAVPALISLNRGMALGLGVGVGYAAIRFALRGHGRALLGVLAVVALAIALGSALNFGSRVGNRIGSSGTNTGRETTYAATWDETLHSPLLGYGAPSSSTLSISGPDLGTQGQFWTVLYSSGFPGAAFFTFALIGFAWNTRRARTPALVWMHVVPIIVLVVVLVYRVEATELVLLMAAVAVVLRDRPRVGRAQPIRTLNRPPALAAAGT
jgi:polysaccharide biosynthesis protein PslJ